MTIGVLRENLPEQRVALLPEAVSQFIALKVNVLVEGEVVEQFGVVLVLLAIGSVIKAVQTGEGLDPGVASASFALLGAMVAGSLGSAAVVKNKKNDDEE